MRPYPTPLAPAPLARDRIDLAGEGDRAAWMGWAAHVDAGRIGAPPPPAPSPPSPSGEYRLAALDRILGLSPHDGGPA